MTYSVISHEIASAFPLDTKAAFAEKIMAQLSREIKSLEELITQESKPNSFLSLMFFITNIPRPKSYRQLKAEQLISVLKSFLKILSVHQKDNFSRYSALELQRSLDAINQINSLVLGAPQ